MRVRDVTNAHRRVLSDLSSRISVRLESAFRDGVDLDGPNLGVMLAERGASVLIEVPFTAFDDATRDVVAREALRVRLKARRDRMMFKAPPAPLAKTIVPISVYGNGRDGARFGGRGRR